MNDVSVYLGRQRGGGVLNRKNAFCARILCFGPGTNVRNYSTWDRNHKKRPQAHSFNRRPLPPLSTWVDRPSPSAFSYCKQSKTGRWEGLGMRLMVSNEHILYTSTSTYQTASIYLPQCGKTAWMVPVLTMTKGFKNRSGAAQDTNRVACVWETWQRAACLQPFSHCRMMINTSVLYVSTPSLSSWRNMKMWWDQLVKWWLH